MCDWFCTQSLYKCNHFTVFLPLSPPVYSYNCGGSSFKPEQIEVLSKLVEHKDV